MGLSLPMQGLHIHSDAGANNTSLEQTKTNFCIKKDIKKYRKQQVWLISISDFDLYRYFTRIIWDLLERSHGHPN